MFQDNPDLWPTPLSLHPEIFSEIDKLGIVLEPQAGSGNLAKAAKSHGAMRVDCIEIDPRLQEMLIGQGLRIIDGDFLGYAPTTMYDTILMNPPFRNGDKHLLKAIEIMYNGQIICILNAETIRNPNTANRRLLSQKIEDLGGVITYKKDAFIDAERKTSVEIAIIKIKVKKNVEDHFFGGMKKADTGEEPTFHGSDIAIPDSQIENYVAAYSQALEIKKEAILKTQESEYYAGIIGASFEDKNYYHGRTITEKVQDAFNGQVVSLRETAWRNIMNLADFHKHLTEKVRNDIQSQMDTVKDLEFTVENIRTFLMNLIGGRRQMMNACVLEVFDNMTTFFHWDNFHETNRRHVEGWKSNERYFVNCRVVLPYLQEASWRATGAVASRDKLCDIEKAVRYVMGEPIADDSIENVLFERESSGYLKAREIPYGQAVMTKYFKIRMYKKGTTHFYWRDKKVLERFNLFVGRQRQWLSQADEQIPKEFWLMCNNNH
jgi:predicted RNA methylase